MGEERGFFFWSKFYRDGTDERIDNFRNDRFLRVDYRCIYVIFHVTFMFYAICYYDIIIWSI